MSSFCTAKATHIFFSKKFQHICVSLDVNFNESLTNDVVSFEQLGPDFKRLGLWCDFARLNLLGIDTFKGSILLKDRHFIIQERFNKLIYGINIIIKCGT